MVQCIIATKRFQDIVKHSKFGKREYKKQTLYVCSILNLAAELIQHVFHYLGKIPKPKRIID